MRGIRRIHKDGLSRNHWAGDEHGMADGDCRCRYGCGIRRDADHRSIEE